VSRIDKLCQKVLDARSDQNIRFAELRKLMLWLGFAERVRGSHHIYGRDDVEEILNLQPRSDGKAKPYQVRQVRSLLIKYRLHDFLDGERR